MLLHVERFRINEEYDDQSTHDEDDIKPFEICVKPPRKFFDTIQEKKQYIEDYTKKKKTELCKNFTMKGQCKFGNECSFAHGQHELQPKRHVHQKYRTKPCICYFKAGHCPYGIRCQYMHEEVKDQISPLFQKCIKDSYKLNNIPIPIPPNKLDSGERYDVQRLRASLKKYQPNLTENLFKFSQSRLATFSKMC